MNTHILEFIKLGNLLLIWNEQSYQEATEIANRLWVKRYRDKGYLNNFSKTVTILSLITQNLGYKVEDMPDGWPPVSPDRDDDVLLYIAMAGKAEYIVTHDKSHLLPFGAFDGIPIGSTGQFFRYLEATYPEANYKHP